MHLLRAITLFLVLVRHGHSASLATPFTGPNADQYSDGDKFSILTGDTPVTIEQFEVHMAEITCDAAIWFKWGYQDWGYEHIYWRAWEGSVTGLGQGVATPLPVLDPPVEIPANSNLGVYLTLKDERANNSKNRSDPFHFSTYRISLLTHNMFTAFSFLRNINSVSQRWSHGICSIRLG